MKKLAGLSILFGAAVAVHAAPICLSETCGFLYSGGAFTVIDLPGARAVQATGINNAGQIVGWFEDAARVTHGFLYSAGAFTTIDVPGADNTIASGINNAGQIVGSFAAGNTGNGYVYTAGSFAILGLNPKPTESISANGINDAGEIVGTIPEFVCVKGSGCPSVEAGFLDNNGAITMLPIEGASGINDIGQVVGTSFNTTNGDEQGILYDAGSLTTIDVPGASITGLSGINNEGSIVGAYCQTICAAGGVEHGFIYQAGVFTRIDYPGGMQTAPFGINDRDQVVGAFTRTPEPVSTLLFATGLLALCFLRRRRAYGSSTSPARR